ncbi:MAG: FlgD immunoglobulin-like domain containing protein [Fimbriimonadaceae bacterium]
MSANVQSNRNVLLESRDESITVPPSVTVPSGQSTASFTITYDGGAGPVTANVVAHSGGYSQRKRVNAVASAAAFAVPSLTARSGRGGVWLSWDGVPEDVFGDWIAGYRVLRKPVGGSFSQIAAGIESGSFVDTTAAEGASYVYKVEVRNGANSFLAGSPEVAHTKTLGAATMTWPSVNLNSGVVTVAFPNPDPTQEHYGLVVDGKLFGTGSATTSNGGSSATIVCEIDTSMLANGNHTAVLVSTSEQADLHASDVKTFKTLNPMSSVGNDGICQTADGEYAAFSAQYLFGATSTIQVLDTNNTVVRSWTFDGGDARVVWDGKDALGATVADGDYKFKSEGGSPANGTFYRLVKVGAAPEFLAIVNYTKDRDPANGYDPDLLTETIAYGNRVRSYVQQLSQNTSGFPWLFYMVYDGELISRETVRKMCKWLRSSASALYLIGHGFRAAEQATVHTVWIGANVQVHYAGLARKGWQHITVPYWVGGRQYRFLLLDTCHSVGSNKSDNPKDCYVSGNPAHGTYMTLYPHKTWAEAYNVDTDEVLEGAFVGFNGQMFFAQGAGLGRWWRDWRDYFWQALSSGNYSVAEALNRADQLLPSFATHPNPSSYCAGAINQPKRKHWGDWRW